MVDIRIGTNENGQRLDRFLRKYLGNAPLSLIYRLIRKDVKVNGRREASDHMLSEGDVVSLYLTDERAAGLRKEKKAVRARKTFRVVYEDEHVLICDKPAGLLTHGDSKEKSEHLTNQVLGYLADKGSISSGAGTFSPSPANRLDRNTSGLVVFAKDYGAQKELARVFRERDKVKKTYLSVCCGEIDREMLLTGGIVKDEKSNTSSMDHAGNVQEEGASKAKDVVTRVKPVLISSKEPRVTLIEVEIETGRTHQIRVQLADSGHPLAGDPKYGDRKLNALMKKEYGLSTQLLTAVKLEFGELGNELSGLSGKAFKAKLPKTFAKVTESLFGADIMDRF